MILAFSLVFIFTIFSLYKLVWILHILEMSLLLFWCDLEAISEWDLKKCWTMRRIKVQKALRISLPSPFSFVQLVVSCTWLSSLSRANRLSIFLCKMVLSNMVSLVVSFFFLNVFCSELRLIKYNTFKEPSLKVQRFPVLVELHDRSLSWSFVCCCSDQLQSGRANCSAELWAGCVSLSVQ